MPSHLKYKSKAQLTKNESLIKITRENNILIDKMTGIDNRANKHISERRACMESPSAVTLNQSVLLKNSDKITEQNGVYRQLEICYKIEESDAYLECNFI